MVQARASYKCHMMQHPLHNWMPAAFPPPCAPFQPCSFTHLPAESSVVDSFIQGWLRPRHMHCCSYRMGV